MGSYKEEPSYPKKNHPISSQAFLTSQILFSTPCVAYDFKHSNSIEKLPLVTSSDLYL